MSAPRNPAADVSGLDIFRSDVYEVRAAEGVQSRVGPSKTGSSGASSVATASGIVLDTKSQKLKAPTTPGALPAWDSWNGRQRVKMVSERIPEGTTMGAAGDVVPLSPVNSLDSDMKQEDSDDDSTKTSVIPQWNAMHTTPAERILLHCAACKVPIDGKGRSIIVMMDTTVPMITTLASLSLTVMSLVSFFVLLLLGVSTMNTSASESSLQVIGWECLCAVLMAVQAVVSTWLAFHGRYRWSTALLVGSCAMEALMLFLVSRTRVLTSAQATEVIIGLHALCTLMFGVFGSVWQRSVNKVKREMMKRKAALTRLQDTFDELTPSTAMRVQLGMGMLQTKFRSMLSARQAIRQRDIKGGWEVTTPARTTLLTLVYTLVLIYIAACVYILLIFAVVFNGATSRAWILSSLLAFLLDGFVYHTVGLCVKACFQFTLLVAKGSDGSTLAKGAGKLFEQVRWLCTNFYQT